MYEQPSQLPDATKLNCCLSSSPLQIPQMARGKYLMRPCSCPKDLGTRKRRCRRLPRCHCQRSSGFIVEHALFSGVGALFFGSRERVLGFGNCVSYTPEANGELCQCCRCLMLNLSTCRCSQSSAESFASIMPTQKTRP